MEAVAQGEMNDPRRRRGRSARGWSELVEQNEEALGDVFDEDCQERFD